MANLRLKKCIYIISLFDRYHKMTQKQIIDAMKDAFPYDNPPSPRTFGRYKDYIEENFPCKLVFDQKSKLYEISRSKQNTTNECIFEYLMSMYNVLDSQSLLAKHSDKIYNAEIITGTENLGVVLRAIDEHKGYTCDYRSFNNNTIKRRTFIPLFLTTFEGRWYVVADVTTHPDGIPYTYALERMSNIVLTEEEMTPYSSCDMEQYFKDSYGIQHHDEKDEPLDILIKAYGSQSHYIQARPIHKSQKLIEDGDDYCIVSLHLTPCFNFYQQLLWHRETIEVLKPECIWRELTNIINKLFDLYT